MLEVDYPANRDEAGRFGPGNQANPSGRPREVGYFRELCRSKTPEVVDMLMDVVRSGDCDGSRVSAGKVLLENAWGRAPLEMRLEVGATLRVNIDPQKAEALIRKFDAMLLPEKKEP